MARAIETASVSASMVTASAAAEISCTVSKEKSGSDSGGRAPAARPRPGYGCAAGPEELVEDDATTLPTSMATIM